MATSLLDLVKLIARRYGHYHSGTADSGTLTTIVDDTLLEPADFWNGHYVYVTSASGAAPEEEQRRISDYDMATQTLTLEPAFTVAIDADDTYLILPFRREDMVDAVAEAIRQAGDKWLVPESDITTHTIGANTFEYALPAAVVRLLNVMVREDSAEPWQSLNPAHWRVAGPAGAQVLYLGSLTGLETGDLLRLDFLKRLTALTTDASELDVGLPAEAELVTFIVQFSLYFLHDLAGNRALDAAALRPHLTKAKLYYDAAKETRENVPLYHGAGRIHGPRKPRSRG